MSEQIYRWILQFYPRAFRERYGDEMVRVLRDRLSHESAWSVWIDVLRDAMVSIPRQHGRAFPTVGNMILRPQPTGPRAPQWQDVVPQGNLIAALAMSALLGAIFAVRIFLFFVQGPWSPLSLVLDGALVVLLAAIVYKATALCRAGAGLRAEATTGAVAILKDDARLQTLRREDVASAEEGLLGLQIRSVAAGGMFVPRRMPGYASVRQSVTGWVPVTPWSLFTSSKDSFFSDLIFVYPLAILAPWLFTQPLPFAPVVAILFTFNAELKTILAIASPRRSVQQKLLYAAAGIAVGLHWWWR